MIFQIYKSFSDEHRDVYFDIECYMNSFDDGNDKVWNTKIKVNCDISLFLSDINLTLNGGQNFINDTDDINNLEKHIRNIFDNTYMDMDNASNRHYKMIIPYLRGMLQEYCCKYGFKLNCD